MGFGILKAPHKRIVGGKIPYSIGIKDDAPFVFAVSGIKAIPLGLLTQRFPSDHPASSKICCFSDSISAIAAARCSLREFK